MSSARLRANFRQTSLGVLGAWLTSSGSALAADAGDAQARQTAQAALDNLATGDAALAKTRLRDALKFCRASSCSNGVYAILYRDLGVVHLVGLHDEAKAKLAFDRAVQLEHGIQLDPKGTSPDAQRLLDAARAALPTKPEPAQAGTAKLWGRGGLQLDLALVGSTSDACTVNGQTEASYYCFRSDGEQYLGLPKAGSQGSVSGGPKIANLRLLLGADVVLGPSFSVGGSIGYALLGGPEPIGGSAFLPLHLEARAAYWFTGAAYPTGGVGVYGLAALGVAQVDSSTKVRIEEDTSVPPAPKQTDNPDSQELTAWKRTGKGFAAVGAGAFFPLHKNGGVIAELRVGLLFPATGMVLSPAAYYTVGF